MEAANLARVKAMAVAAMVAGASAAFAAAADPVLPTDKSAAIAREVKAADQAVEDVSRVVADAARQVEAIDAENGKVKADVDATRLRLQIPVGGTGMAPPSAGTNRPPAHVSAAGAMVIDNFDGGIAWLREDWGDEGTLRLDGGRLAVDFTVGEKKKFAVTKSFAGGLRLSSTQTLILDVDSPGGASVTLAVGLFAGTDYLESAATVLKPGTNRVMFDMSARTYKSASSGWRHTATVPDGMTIDRLTILIYARKPGTLAVDNVRLDQR